MATREVRFPPARTLVLGGVALFVLALLSVREHADKFGFAPTAAARGQDIRNARIDPATGAYVPARTSSSARVESFVSRTATLFSAIAATGTHSRWALMLSQGNRTRANAAFVA